MTGTITEDSMNEEQDIPRHIRKQDRVYTGLAAFCAFHPGPPHGTAWRNDTPAPMSARFFVGLPHGADPKARVAMRTWSGFWTVRIEPGETIELPSVWDDAVQTVQKGRVVSGRLPRARRVEDPAPVPLHPSLEEPGAAPVRRRRRPGGEA